MFRFVFSVTNSEYCSNTVQILFKNCSQIVQKMFKKCSKNVQKLFKYCSNNVQILFKNCSKIVQILFKYWSNTDQILFKYHLDARASNDWKLFLSCLIISFLKFLGSFSIFKFCSKSFFLDEATGRFEKLENWNLTLFSFYSRCVVSRKYQRKL